MNTKREEFSSKEAKLLVIEWKIQVTKRQQLQPILAFCFSTFLVCTCFNIFSQLEQDKSFRSKTPTNSLNSCRVFCVNYRVNAQRGSESETPVALAALVRLYAGVHPNMWDAIARLVECLVAVGAAIRLFPRVNSTVDLWDKYTDE